MDANETKIFIAVLTGLSMQVTLMVFFVTTIFRYQRKKAASHEQKVEEDINSLDKEMERIAFDLHDDFGASLSLLKLRLQMLDVNPGNVDSIESLEAIIDESMKKLRRISQNMMPSILQQRGLDAALRELTDLTGESMGIAVNYAYSVDHCNPGMAMHLYRIAQEALNNIVKHSKATSISLTLVEVSHKIELAIRDNGIGFNKNEAPKKGGLGLHNMAARTELLKGKMYLGTAPGKGVDCLIEIPAYEKNKSHHR